MRVVVLLVFIVAATTAMALAEEDAEVVVQYAINNLVRNPATIDPFPGLDAAATMQAAMAATAEEDAAVCPRDFPILCPKSLCCHDAAAVGDDNDNDNACAASHNNKNNERCVQVSRKAHKHKKKKQRRGASAWEVVVFAFVGLLAMIVLFGY